ncbi:uncharacterized protein LOC144469469 [Augochlora pura]
MKHLVVAAAAAILVLAVTGVSSMALAKGEPPKDGPPKDEPRDGPRDGPRGVSKMDHRGKRSPQFDPMDIMTTMFPRGKRSAQSDPSGMTTTMMPREKRSPQRDSVNCPPPPPGPPPVGDMVNSAQMRKKRFAQEQPESPVPDDSMPPWMLHNGNMGKVSNTIISTS